jgi:CPA2 family monovalent cation:H+ antiporter-2
VKRKPNTGIDTKATILFEPLVGPAACGHLDTIRTVRPSATGCEDCLATGDAWVHLRICLSCGHMGCCDSSPNRHARKHWAATGHPLMRSMEPGETWGWCFVDETEIG